MFGLDRDVLAMLKDFGAHLIATRDHAAGLPSIGADELTVFVLKRMEGWRPQYKGVELADEPTRQAAARFVSGVAVALVKAERGARK